MSSPLSDALEAMVERQMAKEEQKVKNRIEIAMDATEDKTKDKIQEIIDEEAVAKYYGGYDPKMYIRTNQLGNAIKPVTHSVRGGSSIGFDLGARFDETTMDHSVLTIKGRNGKQYTYEGHDADELTILENFRAGEHPNTDVNQGAIWQNDMQGHAPEILKNWVKSGGIREIFRAELRKLMK